MVSAHFDLVVGPQELSPPRLRRAAARWALVLRHHDVRPPPARRPCFEELHWGRPRSTTNPRQAEASMPTTVTAMAAARWQSAPRCGAHGLECPTKQPRVDHGLRVPAPVQTAAGSHPAPCTRGGTNHANPQATWPTTRTNPEATWPTTHANPQATWRPDTCSSRHPAAAAPDRTPRSCRPSGPAERHSAQR